MPGDTADWRTALKAELLKCNLQTVFLYGSNTPVCAYAVIGLINTKNYAITPFGIGKLIGNRFRVGGEHSTFRFTPVVLIEDPAVLAIALAHVGTQRVSHYPTKDFFDTRNGDVGDKRAAWLAEQVRVTSLARQIRQRAQGMAKEEKAQSLREHNQAMAAMYGLKIPYDAPGLDLGWSSTGSFVMNVSCLLQVGAWCVSVSRPTGACSRRCYFVWAGEDGAQQRLHRDPVREPDKQRNALLQRVHG